jgi:hypothetical protein
VCAEKTTATYFTLNFQMPAPFVQQTQTSKTKQQTNAMAPNDNQNDRPKPYVPTATRQNDAPNQIDEDPASACGGEASSANPSKNDPM